MAKRTVAWLGATYSQVGVERMVENGWIACRHTCTWQPPTDVYEDDDGLVVRVEVAGMRSEDFEISLDERILVLGGTRFDAMPKRTYHQMEVRFGEFRAEIYLPWPVDPDSVEASYEEGFLSIRLPRRQSREVQGKETDGSG